MQKRTMNKNYFLVGLILILGLLLIPTIHFLSSSTKYIYANEEGLEYSYISDTDSYEVVGYSGTSSSVVIPQKYNDGEHGEKFVTSIGQAFSDCVNLTSITIPDSVIRISEEAFENTGWYNSKSNGLVYAGKVVYKYKGAAPASVTLESNTKGIAMGAFRGNTHLTSIIIPNNVVYIGNWAFNSCSNLASVNFASGSQLKIIGYGAFGDCVKLNPITIPDSVHSIESCAFQNCAKLDSVNIGINSQLIYMGSGVFSQTKWLDSQPKNGLIYVGKVAYLFKGSMSANTTINLETGTKGIAAEAFNHSNLAAITIPSSVVNINDSAFFLCKSLVSVNFTGSSQLQSFGTSVFEYCESLTSITIPNSVIDIGDAAFRNCVNLISVNFSASSKLKNIGNDIFSYCKKLTSIVIPNSVINIGSYAFNKCLGLTSITIPVNVTNIEGWTFNGCTSLNEVIFAQGSKLKEIDSSAFLNCSRLNSITLPENVAYIGFNCFDGCLNLKTMILRSVTPPLLLSSVSSATTKIYVPAESVTSYKETMGWEKGWGNYGSKIFAEPERAAIIVDTTELEEVPELDGKEIEIELGYEWESLEHFRKENENVKYGYRFTGWLYKGEEVDPETIFDYEDEIIIVPIFEKETYTVSFKLYNEGEATFDSVEVSYNSLIDALPENPKRDGYRFIGWYYNGETKIEKGGIYIIAHNITVVAKWEPKSFNYFLIIYIIGGVVLLSGGMITIILLIRKSRLKKLAIGNKNR